MPSDVPLLPLVELLGALAVTLWFLRTERAGAAPGSGEPPLPSFRFEKAAAIAGLVAVSAPLLWIVPDVLRSTALLPSDASSHAVVAKALATGGGSGGWVDRYSGGFPFFLHYQGLAVVLVAGLIRLGVHPIVATQLVGLAAILATPFVALVALQRAGARPAPALLGAALLALMVCEHPLDGGTEAYLSEGLLSQVVFMPVGIAWIAMILEDRPRGGHLFAAALLPLAHTQLVVALFAAVLPVALGFARGAIRRRITLSALCALAVGVAVYGPGLVRFEVPLGAPEGYSWQVAGQPPSHVFDWLLDGTLLDAGRPPILTSVARVSVLLTLGLALGRSCVRWGLALLAVTTALAVCGTMLARWGAGRAILSLVSPQRATALIPLAISGVVSLGLSEVLARAERAQRDRVARLARGLCWGLVLLALLAAGASKANVLLTRGAVERTWAGDHECGPTTAAGFSARSVDTWVGSLERGRLLIDPASFPDECPIHRGVELASTVPLGASVGGPGSQVGVLESAMGRLDLARSDVASRAETLGVRYVLRRSDGSSPTPPGFRVRDERGSVRLIERTGGTDLFGVGCLVQRWSGPNADLRQALLADFRGDQETLRDPAALIELDVVDGTLRQEPLTPDKGCASHATLVEHPTRPGVYEATVETPLRTFAVVRATFVPGLWALSVDGQPSPVVRVAPGFLATPVPAGEHVVRAAVSWPPRYGPGCLAALGFVVLVTWLERRRGRAATSPRA